MGWTIAAACITNVISFNFIQLGCNIVMSVRILEHTEKAFKGLLLCWLICRNGYRSGSFNIQGVSPNEAHSLPGCCCSSYAVPRNCITDKCRQVLLGTAATLYKVPTACGACLPLHELLA